MPQYKNNKNNKIIYPIVITVLFLVHIVSHHSETTRLIYPGWFPQHASATPDDKKTVVEVKFPRGSLKTSAMPSRRFL